MKGTVIKQRLLNQKFDRMQNKRFGNNQPKAAIKMDIKELMARMWIKCDPNRGGTDPDDIIDREGGTMNEKPEWAWYVPRAEATLKFLDDAGYKIVKK